MNGFLLLELLACAAAILFAWQGLDGAVQGTLDAAALRVGPEIRTTAEVWAMASQSLLIFTGGLVSLVAGRAVGLFRGGRHIPIPFLLPAVMGAVTLGYLTQMGYGDPLRTVAWPGPGFAWGVLAGGVIAGLIMAMPWDPAELASRFKLVLLGFVLSIFLLLAIMGKGPGGTRINLGPIQPIEAMKVAYVAFLAVYLGSRAAKLRHQRLRFGFVRIPRPSLLMPALAVMVVLILALFLVRDLGPTLILGLLFLVLFYLVTASSVWVGLALAVLGSVLVYFWFNPDFSSSSMLSLRLQMWRDPWLNGLPNGDQLALSRWALAAGGLTGQGFGNGAIAALPAGHTDLALAHLAEEIGFAGIALYLFFLFLTVIHGLWVALCNRTPQRILLAAGLSTLILVQWAVIAGGTTGVIPLTGIIVPYLSYGKSGMATFLAVAALLVRLAENGRPVASTQELADLRAPLRWLSAGLAALLILGFRMFFWQGVLQGPDTTLRGVVTTLADGTVVHRPDPRLLAIARAIPRGEILDRDGVLLAGNASDGSRILPLGDALGTLLGPSEGDILRPEWALERIHDDTLRGYPERGDGPSVWLARWGNHERLLFAIPDREEKPRDRKRAEAMAASMAPSVMAGSPPTAPQASVRLLPLPAPDFSAFLPLLHQHPTERRASIQAIANDKAARQLRLTLHAGLQQATRDALAKVAPRGKAAAAVVIDVDSGQVLARAQVPDYDPGQDRWRQPVIDQDPVYTGVYGPWSDKTGARGIFQTGSIFKIATSLAAARAEMAHSGDHCAIEGDQHFKCVERDSQGPLFDLPGWERPIHDHHRDGLHGDLEIVEALAVSCNVFFGQLGLDLGPEPFRKLVADGLEVGWSHDFQPGEPGSRRLASTAFGQGAAAMNVAQAARMTATVASGGVYRRCPSDLLADSPCKEIPLVRDGGSISLILAGLRRVIDEGTARHLTHLQGVRVYGKTGTADAVGLPEEAPYGVRSGSVDSPAHSWFVAIAESAGATPCEAGTSDRLALAVVVPRGGAGAGAAGSAAIDIIAAANALGLVRGVP